MIRVTLDTNVLVSATFWTGDSFRVLELIEKGQIMCVLSHSIISEYIKVINREEILDKREKNELVYLKLVQEILSMSLIIEPKRELHIIDADISDNRILECAVEGRSDFIITNDRHLLRVGSYTGIRIVKPGEFLGIMHS
jgi:putative PIN family toxin of toxin-antitoxin system